MTHEHAHGPTAAGSVILDLGADVGALILTVPADLDGAEIEISRDGAPRAHSQVRRRITPGGVRYAAIYPGLAAGDYTLWADAVTPALTFTVHGGQVTSCDWPERLRS